MPGIRVLIVDDSAVMRKIVERSLRSAGVELASVLEAGSGVQGIELLRAQEVDLIFSDINMPQMNGLEFLRQVAADGLSPGTPIVMITTEGSTEHVSEAIQAGARGYILKPFTPEHIKERVLPLLEGVA